MLTFLKEQRAKSLPEKAKLTRQMTLESAFSRATAQSAPKDLSSTPSLTTGTSQTDNSSELSDTVKHEDHQRSSSRPRQRVGSYNENALAAKSISPNTKVRDSGNHALSETTSLASKRPGSKGQAQAMDERTTDAIGKGGLFRNLMEKHSPMKSSSARLSLFSGNSETVWTKKSSLGKRSREDGDSAENDRAALYGITNSRLRSRGPKENAETSVVLSDKVVKTAEKKSVSVSPEAVTPRKAPKKSTKIWLSQGLYVGQDRDFDARFTESENKTRQSKPPHPGQNRRALMPLPMFSGQRLLEQGRSFRLPFDVFSPLPPGQPKPDEWKKTQKNVFIGDAANVWKKTKPLEQSTCICTSESGCDENCFNRFMLYECDDTNCNIGAERCTNRSFAGLKQRQKAGGKYNIGVEVMKTGDRGYGIRANRSFAPHQVIVEYTGEIITQEECESRMRGRYKDAECYYLMEFEQSMILDATRGSIARFVNHSCSPNCRMVKWTVQGKPRMALFAGDKGIMTGEELTYDYNFNPYSIKNVQKCLCGADNCRGVLGPRPKEIKEALNPIANGGKRKFQQVVEDAVEGAKQVAKRRKINISVPKSVKDVVEKAKEHVIGGVKKAKLPPSKKKPLPVGWVYVEEMAEPPPPRVRSIFGTDPELLLRSSRRQIKAPTSTEQRGSKAIPEDEHSTRSASKESAADSHGEADDQGRRTNDAVHQAASVGRNRTTGIKSSSMRNNVVRTIKGRHGSRAWTTAGKSIRVIGSP